ncbi:MAG: hypothetical protein R6U86_00670, partial [Bacteroidales bacterium]
KETAHPKANPIRDERIPNFRQEICSAKTGMGEPKETAHPKANPIRDERIPNFRQEICSAKTGMGEPV